MVGARSEADLMWKALKLDERCVGWGRVADDGQMGGLVGVYDDEGSTAQNVNGGRGVGNGAEVGDHASMGASNCTAGLSK